MRVGDKVRVRAMDDVPPSVKALAGKTGVIEQMIRYAGDAPIIVRLDDGKPFHCWPNELEPQP